nr:zinc finger, CCHC-type [Tanacetum cinerariifolium]
MDAAAMKHMASNIANLDKFEGVHFRRWQKKIHFLLSSMSVMYMLTTLIPDDGGNAIVDQIRKRAKWDNDNYVRRGLIFNGMSDSLFDIYQNVESSKELRDSLEAKYMAEDASSKKFLINNFTNYKMTDSRPVMEQYNKLLDFKHTLKHLKEELTLVELGGHLCIKEFLRMQDSDKPKGNNVVGPSVVNMVEHNNFSRYNDNKVWETHLKKDCKGGKVGNKANGSGTNGSVDGFTNSLKGATVHVGKDRCGFKTYESLNDGSILHMGTESTSLVHGRGCVDLKFSSGKIVSLFNVLHVPNIRKNLDMGEDDVILSIRIKHKSNGIAISQSHYIEKVLKKFNYFDCTPVSTLMDTSVELMPNNGQYTSNPGTHHWQAIQWVLKYLKKTMDYRLTKTGYPSFLEGYTDANWISKTKDNSSISGRVFLLGGAAGKEAKWLKNLLLEIPLWSKPIAPISIRCDSAAILAKAYSQMYNGKSRHLGVWHNIIRELIANRVISIEFVRSQQNLADHLIKGLARDLVIKSIEGMGLIMSVVYVLTTLILDDGDDATVDQIKKRDKWDNDDYVCRGLILNGMSDSLFDIYQNVESSKELWDSLEAKYLVEDASSKKFLVSNFTNYKMTDSRPVMEQYNELLDFKHTLKHLKEDITLAELGSHLCIEESLRMQDCDKPKGNNVIGPSVVNMVEHNNFSRYNDNKGKRKHHNNTRADPNKKSKVTCWKCGKPDTCKRISKVYYVTYVSEAYFVKDDDVAWWVDSGATVHVCKDRCWFKTYESLDDGSILHMGNESTSLVHGRGCVDLKFSSGKIVSLFNVLHVSNIRKNLVSSSVLNNCGYKQVIESNKFVLSKHAFMSTSKLNDSILCHARLGNIHFKRMQDMSKDGLIPAFDMDIEKCKTCMLNKIRNKKYFGTSIDDASRFCYVYLLHSKDEALDKFKMDVKTTFLNGDLDEEVYINQPQGFIMPENENKVCKLIKSLYGLKLAPKKWHQKFNEVVLSNGYLLNQADKCVYSKFDESSKGVIICLYVDDMLIFGTDQVQVDLTKKFLSIKFSMKDMGEVDVIFGIRIKHESNGIAISQSHYIEKVLKKFNYYDCTPVSTPMDTSEKLMPNNGQTVSLLEYSRVIGCLMYAWYLTLASNSAGTKVLKENHRL